MNVRQTTLRVAVCLALIGLAGGSPLAVMAADPVVPPDIQAALTLRILEYDRGLKSWAGMSLRVGVVSKNGLDAYTGGLDGKDVQGLALTAVQTRPRDGAALASWIQQEGIGLLYVAADLGADASSAIAAAASAKIPSLTTTRDHFDDGGVLGIVVRDGKPHILVRLADARTAGMDLDPKLLRLAEVIQ